MKICLERERGEGFNKDQNDKGVLKEIRVFSKNTYYPPIQRKMILIISVSYSRYFYFIFLLFWFPYKYLFFRKLWLSHKLSIKLVI